MLALSLDYLTGRAIATAYNDRSGAEWPPHPARVFSALVATWAEQDPLDAPEAEAERAALEWLEQQESPAIACEEGRTRSVMTHFVPINDVSLLPSRLDSLAAKLDVAQSTLQIAEAEAAIPSADNKAAKALTKAAEKAKATLVKTEAQYQEACSIAFAAGPSSADERRRAAALLPESRGRQPRTFPSLALPDPVVHLCWPSVADCPHQPALNRLATRLVRIGHSSSFVHARWLREAPEPSWIPHERGELLLRVIGPGQFERLRAEFERHGGIEPRVLPFRAQRYRASNDISRVAHDDARHFDAHDWIILKRVGGPSLPLTRAVDLATAVRGALMRHADQPVAEVISGHVEKSGEPSRTSHLLILPLAHVGHRHADGAIKGVALLLPRTLDDAARRPMLRALARWEAQTRNESGEPEDDAPTLKLGLRDALVLEVQRQVWGDPGLSALRPATWCEGACDWLSVTPVALDRNPGDLTHADATKRQAAFRAAAESIAKACENIGLPLPEAVTILPSGTWTGGAKATSFPAYPSEPGKLRRVKVHARIRFSQAVQGPVILGAGRFLGLGLFKPIKQEGTT
jgi:CRISPR-associated protein Csb2